MATATPLEILTRWSEAPPSSRERFARALESHGDRALHAVLRRWTDRAISLRSADQLSGSGRGQADHWALAVRLAPLGVAALLRWTRPRTDDAVPLSDRVVLFRTRAMALLLGLSDDLRPTDEVLTPLFRHYLVEAPPRSLREGHPGVRYEPPLRAELIRLLSRAPTIAHSLAPAVRRAVRDSYVSVRREAVRLAMETANRTGAEGWNALLPILRDVARDQPGDDMEVLRALVREPHVATDPEISRLLASEALTYPELRPWVVDLFPAPVALSLLRGVWVDPPTPVYVDLLRRAAARPDIAFTSAEVSALVGHADASVREAGLWLAAHADTSSSVSRHRQIGRTGGNTTLSLR